MMNPIKPAMLVGAIALLATGPSAAVGQSFPLECAIRDVQLVTQIEQHGDAQDVPGEILYEAFLTMKRAREACSEGRPLAGLALYDSIFKTSLAGRTQMR
jgi:hypothetical protein